MCVSVCVQVLQGQKFCSIGTKRAARGLFFLSNICRFYSHPFVSASASASASASVCECIRECQCAWACRI